jgi:hypothetical protein
MKVIHALPLALVVLCVSSCKRDVPASIQCERVIGEDELGCSYVNHELHGPDLTSPTVNPSNADEIAFVQDNSILVKANIKTRLG